MNDQATSACWLGAVIRRRSVLPAAFRAAEPAGR